MGFVPGRAQTWIGLPAVLVAVWIGMIPLLTALVRT